MSEETKKTPQAEEPAVELNTAEQAAPETAPEQAAAPETNAEAADPKKRMASSTRRPGSWRP